ncbi:MAG: hypothetical protein ACXWVF_17670, partial [Telluria sp.]
MHVVSDPVRHVRTNGVCSTARVSARLVLSDGTIFAVIATADRDCVLDVLRVAASSFAGQRFDESCFGTLDAAAAAALSASGYEATISLELHATILPRPLLSAGQISRLALHAINVRRSERGEPPMIHLPAHLADAFAAACSFDDPAVHAFRAVLAAQVTAFQHSARVVHGVTLNSLAVYNFLAVPSARCRNRVQAMEVLPWLLPMQISPGDGRMIFEVVAVRGAIDAGSALFDAVGQAFGVKREVVRWLGRRALPREWTLDAPRLRRLLALLSWLPPERRPQTVEEFDALIVLGNAAIAPLGFHGDDQAPPMPGSAACMRPWLLEIMRPGLVPATAAPGFAQLANELADAKDFLRALCEAMQSFDRLDHGTSVLGVL